MIFCSLQLEGSGDDDDFDDGFDGDEEDFDSTTALLGCGGGDDDDDASCSSSNTENGLLPAPRCDAGATIIFGVMEFNELPFGVET